MRRTHNISVTFAITIVLLIASSCVWPQRRYQTADETISLKKFYEKQGLDPQQVKDAVALDKVLQGGQKVYVPYERLKKPETLAKNRASKRSSRQQTFIWPIQGGLLSSEFGYRWNRFHEGIDLISPIGTPIHAVGSGTVIYSGNGIKGYGNMVVIKHHNGLSSVYAHNQQVYVKKGQSIRRGDKVATLGNSGKTTGAHLHFEVRESSRPVDPMLFLPKRKKKRWSDYVIR